MSYLNISIPLKYYQDKSRINKADNQITAYKIQLYANKVTDEYIGSYQKGLPRKPSQAVLNANLTILNKPEIYKSYMRIVNSPYVDATYSDRVIMKNKANANLNYIVEQEIIRLIKNLDVIEHMVQNYEFSYQEYQALVAQQEAESLANSNRYQILKQVIENFDGNDSFKIPEGYHYHEIKYTAENLLRQSQMKSQTEQIKFINKKNREKGIDEEYVEKYWIHTHRGKTTRHMSNHMQHVPIDQPFIVVNDYTLEIDEMMYPCDPMGRPSNSYICYCEMEYRTADGKIFIDPLQLEENVVNVNNEVIYDEYDMDSLDRMGRPVENEGDAVVYRSKDGKYQIVGENPYNTNEGVEEASLNFARKCKDDNHESLTFITDKGKVGFFNGSGDKSKVGYKYQDLVDASKYKGNGEYQNDYQNIINIHNHPVVVHERDEFSFDGIADGLPTYFSKADLKGLTIKCLDDSKEIMPCQQIQVYANSGFRLTITRDGGNPLDNHILNNPKNKMDIVDYNDKIKNDDTFELELLNKEMDNIGGAYRRMINTLDDDAYDKYTDNYRKGMYGKNKMSNEERAQHLKEVTMEICKNDAGFNKAIYDANNNLKPYGFRVAGEWCDV